MQLRVIAKYTLIEAHKRRFILIYGLTLLVCIALASYAGSLAIIAKHTTVAAFYGFFSRVTGISLLGIYIILNESRAFESPHASTTLGLPISRATFLFNKYLAYLAITLAIALFAMLPLLLTSLSGNTVLTWAVTFFFELLIVAFVALMLVILFDQPLVSIPLLAAFYLFSRNSTEFLRYSNHILDSNPGLVDQVLVWPVKIAGLLTPRLEQFSASHWLLYDDISQVQWLNICAQTGLYALLILAISLSRLKSKAF